MKKLTQIAGLAGLVIIILGGVVGIVQQRLSAVTTLHLFVGGGLLVLGVLGNLSEIKEALMKRSARMGPQLFIQVVLILLILSFLNVISMRHNVVRDMTRRHLFSFGKVTEDVVSNLPGDVEVIAFFPGGGPGDARQRLSLYESRFPRVKLRFVDPDKHEDVARAEAIPPEVGALFKYKTNRVWITKFEENDITNAFIKVTRETQPSVWFTTGHGEPDLDSKGPNGLAYLHQMLLQQGYEPKVVDLDTLDEIPGEVSMAAIVGPVLPFSEHDFKMLDHYLGQGGNLLIFLDPVFEVSTITGLENFIAPYGIDAHFNIIFDPKQHLSMDRLGVSIVAADMGKSQITEGLSQPRLVFSMARSLTENSYKNVNMEIDRLVMTSSDSYERTFLPEDLVQFQTPESLSAFIQQRMGEKPGPKEVKGPFVLAYAVNKRHRPEMWKEKVGVDKTMQMRLVVAGASSVCRNATIPMPYNYEFVMNAFNWLAGEMDLKYIRSVRRGGTRLNLDEQQKDRILYISIMILPELFMIIGLAVWWRRR